MALTFLLQALARIIHNETLFQIAPQILGQEPEAVFVDGLILWFAMMWLWDTRIQLKAFGLVAVIAVVSFELYRRLLSYGGTEPPGILNLTLLLPFVNIGRRWFGRQLCC